MTGSRQPQLTEELLSAYLDDEVTAEERALVEAAMAADPAIAWQVESLRQTVHLLQALPPLALPRTFTLEAVMANVQTTKMAAAPHTEPAQPRAASSKPSTVRPTLTEQQGHWWQWVLQIWQGGNLQLRNAAAVAFTLLIVLVLSDRLVAPTHLRQPTVIPVPAAKVLTTSDGAVAASAAIMMTTAPMETATTLAETATAPSLAAATNGDTATPAPSAKVAPDQNSTTTALGAAKLPPPSQPREDTFAMDGSHSGNLGDQPGQGSSIASMMTDDSRAMATASSGPAALTQAVPNGAANQVRSASSMAITATSAAPLTVTVTVTPTPTITATATISDASSSTNITSTAVLTVPSATPPTAATSWLAWAEMVAGVGTVILGGLWWRSRGDAHA